MYIHIPYMDPGRHRARARGPARGCPPPTRCICTCICLKARPVNYSPPGACKEKTTGIKRTLTYMAIYVYIWTMI